MTLPLSTMAIDGGISLTVASVTARVSIALIISGS
jgi:riboflavin synthase alpha subunit